MNVDAEGQPLYCRLFINFTKKPVKMPVVPVSSYKNLKKLWHHLTHEEEETKNEMSGENSWAREPRFTQSNAKH